MLYRSTPERFNPVSNFSNKSRSGADREYTDFLKSFDPNEEWRFFRSDPVIVKIMESNSFYDLERNLYTLTKASDKTQ